MRSVKSANSKLFKDFYNEAEMEKNKTDGGLYFVIIPKAHIMVRGADLKGYNLLRTFKSMSLFLLK